MPSIGHNQLIFEILPWASKENHWQTFAQVYNPGYAHEIVVPTATLQPMVMDERKIIARRAAMESWNELAGQIRLKKTQLPGDWSNTGTLFLEGTS
jgi:hypothetical protein